jgi:hypothetical protein
MFGKDGIAKIKKEYVFCAAKQLTVVMKSLTQVDTLLDDAVGDVMDGLSNGFVSKFTEVFKLESTMYCSVQSSTAYSGCSQMALSQVLSILYKATGLHNSLSTGNNWNIPTGYVSKCWNLT